MGTIKQGVQVMATKQVKTVKDKLSSVSESFTVNMYDNGFMIEVTGHRHSEDGEDSEWACAKIIVPTVEELCELIQEVSTLKRDNDL